MVLGSFLPKTQLAGLALTWLLPSQFYLCCQQFYAMFMKRAMYSWRNWKMVAAQFLVPLIFTAFALIVAKTFPGPRDSSLLRLTLEPYGQTIVPFSAASGLSQRLAEQYVELLDAQRQSPLKVPGEASQSTHGVGDARRGGQEPRASLARALGVGGSGPSCALSDVSPCILLCTGESHSWQDPSSPEQRSITLCLWPSSGLGWPTRAGAAWGLFQLAPVSSRVMEPLVTATVFSRWPGGVPDLKSL